MDRIPQSMIDDLATTLAGKAGTGAQTVTGDQTISKATPTLILDKTGNSQYAAIFGRRAGSTRWSIALGNETAETGSGNVGSDFTLNRYSDANAFIDSPMSILRSNGELLLKGRRAIEHVSNGNGRSVKFADGTLVCWFERTTGPINPGMGNVAVLGAETWTFPVAFIDRPFATLTRMSGWVYDYNIGFEGLTATAMSGLHLKQIGTGAGNPITHTLYYLAIGRWF